MIFFVWYVVMDWLGIWLYMEEIFGFVCFVRIVKLKMFSDNRVIFK